MLSRVHENIHRQVQSTVDYVDVLNRTIELKKTEFERIDTKVEVLKESLERLNRRKLVALIEAIQVMLSLALLWTKNLTLKLFFLQHLDNEKIKHADHLHEVQAIEKSKRTRFQPHDERALEAVHAAQERLSRNMEQIEGIHAVIEKEIESLNCFKKKVEDD